MPRGGSRGCSSTRSRSASAPNPSYIPRYRNLFGDKRNYLRGFGYEGGASRQGWSRAVAELGIGGDMKDHATEPGEWTLGGTAFGEILPNHDNKVSLDETRKDKWGLPVLKIECDIGENERNMRVDMMNDMAEMLTAAGVKDVKTFDYGYAMGQGIHEMGTARMGTDPTNSVLNKHNQVWDAPNVFVTDGACMASAACQNPVAVVHGVLGASGGVCGFGAEQAQSLSSSFSRGLSRGLSPWCSFHAFKGTVPLVLFPRTRFKIPVPLNRSTQKSAGPGIQDRRRNCQNAGTTS